MKFPSIFSIELENNMVVPIRFQLEFDNLVVDEKIVDRTTTILSYEFDDTGDTTHAVKLIMSGKKNNDDVSNFLSTVRRVTLDYIDITKLFSTGILPYWHDENGNKPMKQDQFYWHLGCDGFVEFYFSSPAYKWISVITQGNHGY